MLACHILMFLYLVVLLLLPVTSIDHIYARTEGLELKSRWPVFLQQFVELPGLRIVPHR